MLKYNGMQSDFFIRLELDVLALVVIIAVFVGVLRQRRDENQRAAFISVIFASVISILANDFFIYIHEGFFKVYPVTFKIVALCMYLANFLTSYSWFEFSKTQLNFPLLDKHFFKYYFNLIFVGGFVIVLYNFFSDQLFNVIYEEEKLKLVYHKKWIWFVYLFINLNFILVPVFVSFIKIARTSVSAHRLKYFFTGGIVLIPFLFQILYDCTKYLTDLYLPYFTIGGTVSILLGYFIIMENNREKEQKKLFNITNALSLDYGSVYYVNAINKRLSVMRLDELMKDYYLKLFTNSSSYDEVINFCVKHLLFEEDRTLFSETMDCDHVRELLYDRETYSFDFRGKNEQSFRYIRVKLIKTDVEVEHFIIGVKDITSEVGKQEQYHDDLQNALIEARSANKAKSIFLSNMSHDIRTPMNAIIGFTDIARENIEDKEKLLDCLNKITSSSNHLLSIINDVLDMSRIENGRLSIDLVPVDLNNLLEEVSDLIYPDVTNKNISFNLIKTSIVHNNLLLDPMRVKQIFLNLLSNSMKFTQIGGNITFEIQERNSINPEYAFFHCVISDNGCGISQDFMKRMFEPFARERSTTDSGIAGTGLGLTIVKNIVQKLQGHIFVTSQPGKGTDFVLDISFKINAENKRIFEPVEFTADGSLLSGLKILLVEDNELNREIAKNILVRYKADVTELVNCREAVDLILDSHKDDFDLVLMDIQTPFMNGYDATRKIRAQFNHPLKDIPIIAMTANAFEEDKQLALQSGMNAHIAKPINVQNLLQTISSVMKDRT